MHAQAQVQLLSKETKLLWPMCTTSTSATTTTHMVMMMMMIPRSRCHREIHREVPRRLHRGGRRRVELRQEAMLVRRGVRAAVVVVLGVVLLAIARARRRRRLGAVLAVDVHVPAERLRVREPPLAEHALVVGRSRGGGSGRGFVGRRRVDRRARLVVVT